MVCSDHEGEREDGDGGEQVSALEDIRALLYEGRVLEACVVAVRIDDAELRSVALERVRGADYEVMSWGGRGNRRGSGNGHRNGRRFGYGNGNGYGLRFGYGGGNGHGHGDGYSFGYGDGNGDGYIFGYGDGYGFGCGFGSSYSDGDGSGNGDGNGLQEHIRLILEAHIQIQ